MKKDEPPLEFPDTLEGFEYIFNESKSYMIFKGYTQNSVEVIRILIVSPYQFHTFQLRIKFQALVLTDL